MRRGVISAGRLVGGSTNAEGRSRVSEGVEFIDERWLCVVGEGREDIRLQSPRSVEVVALGPEEVRRRGGGLGDWHGVGLSSSGGEMAVESISGEVVRIELG